MLLNFVLLLGFVQFTCGFRALYMATNVGYSHLEFTGRLADVLIEAGHEVDFVIQDWNSQLKTNGSKKANVIRFVGKNVAKMEALTQQMTIAKDSFSNDLTMQDWAIFGESYGLHCEALLADHTLLNYMRTRKYTVGLAEEFDGCALAVFNMLGIRSVHETSVFPLSDTTALAHGIPIQFRHMPSYFDYPNLYFKQILVFQSYLQNQPIRSFSDVLYNFYTYLLLRFQVQYLYFGRTNEVIQRILGAAHPTIDEMRRHTSYIWVNNYEFMDFARLNSPKVKYLGGIVICEPPVMNKDMEQIFERARKGVVLVSFGSVVNTTYMSRKIRMNLLETFASFPDYEFVWRFTDLNDQILADLRNYSNVHGFKWLQQTAVLAHPKTAAFITHGGTNSVNEAAHFGVPLVVAPFFGDHFLNAAAIVKRGNGIHLKKQNLEMIRDALDQVLHNKKYREKALDLKAKITNMSIKPEELFVRHVEFSEKFDVSRDLELDTASDSFIEQFNLDLISLALLFMMLSVYLLYKFLLFTYKGFVLMSTVMGNSLRTSKKLD